MILAAKKKKKRKIEKNDARRSNTRFCLIIRNENNWKTSLNDTNDNMYAGNGLKLISYKISVSM